MHPANFALCVRDIFAFLHALDMHRHQNRRKGNCTGQLHTIELSSLRGKVTSISLRDRSDEEESTCIFVYLHFYEVTQVARVAQEREYILGEL